MKKGLLSSVALGALLLPIVSAFAADPVVIPLIVPVEEPEEVVNPIAITLTQTLGKQDDDWEAETELEVEAALRNGLGILLNLYNTVEFVPGNPPPEWSPGFRLTVQRAFGNFTLGAFAGIIGDDLPGGDWLWEVGLGLAGEVGPAEIEAEVRREQEFGGGATFFAEAEAAIGIGELITIVGGVEVEFAGPAEFTAALAIELALGRVTIIPSIQREFAGPETTLGLEVQFQVTDRLTIGGGIEREETDPPFIWGGFELALGGGN